MRHAKATPRQSTAAAKVLVSLAALIVLILVAGGYRVHHQGWSFFIERPPGIGATELEDD